MARGTYSYSELEQLWVNAGGSQEQAPVAAAIALAESAGNPRARNPSGASGLWQILGDPFPGNAFNPQVNARMAVAKYNAAGGFSPWVTYTQGTYRQFLQQGTQPGAPVYRNPFRGISSLTAERVDMGADYSGTGPVYALGPGVITEADQSWAGGYGTGPGTFIAEKLTKGPAAGHYVYVAEHLTPTVRAGQRVDTGTKIGDMTGGIETGWAAGPSEPGTTLAQQLGQIPASGDPGAHPTASGAAYSQLLRALGAPAATQSGTPVGSDPGWLQGVLNGISGLVGGVSGGTGGGLAGVAGPLSSIASSIQTFEQAVAWLVNPSHWVRIISGVFGTGLVIAGLVEMTRTGRAYSVDVPVVGQVPTIHGGQIAPALAIAMVTTGAVLLFVAFHNLPGEVTDFPSLLGYFQENLHKQGAGQ